MPFFLLLSLCWQFFSGFIRAVLKGLNASQSLFLAIGFCLSFLPLLKSFLKKNLALVSGIGILAGMITHFYGFNWLAACVAAAVSESKKAVSAVAAAVVGIGLFLAPMEKAQANHGDIPVVLSVDVVGCWDDDPDDFVVDWVLSGLIDNWPAGYISQTIHTSNGCLYEGGYTVIKLHRFVRWLSDGRPVVSRSDWIEIWVWMGNDNSEPAAWVEDSEGNSYDVDLYVDGYGPWPTW